MKNNSSQELYKLFDIMLVLCVFYVLKLHHIMHDCCHLIWCICMLFDVGLGCNKVLQKVSFWFAVLSLGCQALVSFLWQQPFCSCPFASCFRFGYPLYPFNKKFVYLLKKRTIQIVYLIILCKKAATALSLFSCTSSC